jgi:hypothetical protein
MLVAAIKSRFDHTTPLLSGLGGLGIRILSDFLNAATLLAKESFGRYLVTFPVSLAALPGCDFFSSTIATNDHQRHVVYQ